MLVVAGKFAQGAITPLPLSRSTMTMKCAFSLMQQLTVGGNACSVGQPDHSREASPVCRVMTMPFAFRTKRRRRSCMPMELCSCLTPCQPTTEPVVHKRYLYIPPTALAANAFYSGVTLNSLSVSTLSLLEQSARNLNSQHWQINRVYVCNH